MIDRFDHLVLTVGSIARTVEFYVGGLGMQESTVNGRTALLFGQQKINLHEASGAPILPRAEHPRAGSADFCLVTTDRQIEAVLDLLQARNIAIELGPVERDGALGRMRSVYLRDPDGNLIEISSYGVLASP